MKIKYYAETDSLYIDLSAKKAVDSREIEEGIVLDFDENGHLAGIDIDQAAKHLDLKEVVLSSMPSKIKTLTGKSA